MWTSFFLKNLLLTSRGLTFIGWRFKWKWNVIHFISEFACNQTTLKFFVWKGNSTIKDKKLTSFFAIEWVFFYLYRDSKDITVAEHAVSNLLQVIMEAVVWLVTTTAVNLMERLKVLQRLLRWIFRYFKSWRQNSATFSQLARRRTRSALRTDRVSVAQNKSNVATPETRFR